MKLAVLAAAVLVAAAVFAFLDAAFLDRSAPREATTAIVVRGDTLAEAVGQLQSDGVVAHPLAFRILARLRGEDAALQSGAFRFAPHETTAEILHVLVFGQPEARWVTIPEGFTVRQIGSRLAELGLVDAPAFDRYCLATGLSIDGSATRGLEGFLFPSTYLIPVDATAPRIARILTDQFARELPPDAEQRARKLGLSIPQVIAVASLVEREAKADDERALMAGVYYNRLRAGMPLEVDASIEYALPVHHTVITSRDLAIDSPYNTYRHTGLPPTPIANPGKASIDAAFAPKPSAYLYYVYKGNGHHAFAQTYQEHEANVAHYLH